MAASPRCLFVAITAVVFATWTAVAGATEAERVSFPSTDTNAQQITALLYRPSTGAGPFPAVVALHGCGGLLTKSGQQQKREKDWAERLVASGIVVLFPDSFNPRGFSQICTQKQSERTIVPFDRSFDANGAAEWLATQQFIDKSRLGLLGWSHGGSTVLWTVRAGGAPKSAEFKTAIAFYPGCRVPAERASWKPRLPLKILIGAADDWTPPGPCRELSKKHGVSYVEYSNAYHGFDAPDSPVRLREGLGMTAGNTGKAHIGTDPAARSAAIIEVMTIFKSAFGLPK